MRTLVNSPRSERRGRSDVVATGSRGERRGFQIGPRIRIGGTVGKIASKVQQFVPDFRSMIGGALLGPVGGVATSAINGTLGHDIKTGATNAGVILGGKALLSHLGGGGGAAAGSWYDPSTGESVAAGTPGAIESPGDYAPGGGSSPWDTAKRVFGGVKDGITGAVSGGKGSPLDKVLAGAGLVSSYLDKKRQEDLQNKGLGFATDSYNERAPLRQFGLSMLQPGATVASPTANASAGSRIPATQSLLDAANKPAQSGGGY